MKTKIKEAAPSGKKATAKRLHSRTSLYRDTAEQSRAKRLEQIRQRLTQIPRA